MISTDAQDRLVRTTATKLRAMTADNEHLGALRLAARTFLPRNHRRLVEALDALGVLHAYQGSLDEHLSAVETRLRKHTMAALRMTLPEHHYDIVRGAL